MIKKIIIKKKTTQKNNLINDIIKFKKFDNEKQKYRNNENIKDNENNLKK